MKSEEKLKRFDDIYKLSLTLVAITLAFGSTFLEDLGVDFFALIVSLYFVVMGVWGLGHLTENVQSEVFLKLSGWWILTTILPVIILNYLVPIEPEEIYPPYLASPILALGFLLYWSCFRYVREYLSIHLARALWLFPLIATILFAIANLVKWAFLMA